MKLNYIALLGLLLLVSTTLFGQNAHSHQNQNEIQKCAQHQQREWLLEQNPDLREEIKQTEKALEAFTEAFVSNWKGNKRAGNDAPLHVIPMVFHIIHQNGRENISDDQVYDAVRIINEDFNKLNQDLQEVIPEFRDIIGDGRIEFRLARIDPFGNPTNGIDRVVSAETFIGDDGSKLNRWPRDSYLNIWVCNNITSGSGNNAAAYAYLPSSVNSNPNIDGIIANHRYVGSIGTSSEQGMHTLSHEIGHFLNLLHPWGPSNNAELPSNCSLDDGVLDTPVTEGTQGGCNLVKSTCGSLDNIQNIMDYAACDRMFTQGQVGRMYATLNSNTADRRDLWQQSNLQETGVADLVVADFTMRKPYACQLDSIQFFDASIHGAENWSWNFELGSPLTSSDRYPKVKYDFEGAHNVTLEASNATENVSITKSNAVLINPLVGLHTPYLQNFSNVTALPYDEWIGINPYDDPYRFEIDASAGVDNDACISMKNSGNPFETEDELVSTTFDLSMLTSATFSFKYAGAQTNAGNQDRMYLYVSTNCGETWLPRWSESGSQLATAGVQPGNWSPTAADWQTETINLSPNYLVENLMFRFVFEADGGNNFYLDDINIQGQFSDIAVLEFPENGATAMPDDILLQWKAVGGADGYEYNLDTDQSFNSANLQAGTKNWINNDPNNTDTEFDAQNLIHGQTYYWRVRLIKNGNPMSWSSVWSFTVSDNGVGFDEWSQDALGLKVFPNPTDGNSTLKMNLPEQTSGEIVVYSTLGSEIDRIPLSGLSAGTQTVSIGSNVYTTGIYLLRVQLNNKNFTQRLVVQ